VPPTVIPDQEISAFFQPQSFFKPTVQFPIASKFEGKKERLPQRDIIVIGGSAGAFEPVKTIIGGLPASFPGSVFIVIHMMPEFPSLMEEHLSSHSRLPITQAADEEPIRRGHIYIARPDYHLAVESGRMRVLRGPRENRHRPAIDPLFRTAARVYGPRVIGVILSGNHDDGSVGLYGVKQRGGIAIVQDPAEAGWSEMPRRALAYATPHYVLNARDIASNLIELVQIDQDEIVMPNRKPQKANGKSQSRSGTSGRVRVAKKVRNNGRSAGLAKSGIEGGEHDENLKVAYFDEGEGTPSVFACPECHGVLWELRDGDLVRFRCRVGHSYGTESLATELSGASEAALWAAMRALEEKAAMQRRIADGLNTDRKSSSRLRDQSTADNASARVIRDMIFARDAALDQGNRTELEKSA
jgi:two-component system, chemotaxis family, protein-glutamate methylesterase/glutaminase